jgi:hypothetical protein
VRDDQRPKEKEPLAGIEEEHRVGFRETGGVGQNEGRGPRAGAAGPARGVDEDVVRGALTGAVEPADEQVAVGQFDDGRGVVVPFFRREDQFAGVLGRRHGAGGGKEKTGGKAHGHQYTSRYAALLPGLTHAPRVPGIGNQASSFSSRLAKEVKFTPAALQTARSSNGSSRRSPDSYLLT